MTITIKSGIPAPEGRRTTDTTLGRIRAALTSLKPDDVAFCEDCPNHNFYMAAKQLGIKITTRKTDAGYKVWNLGPRKKPRRKSRYVSNGQRLSIVPLKEATP